MSKLIVDLERKLDIAKTNWRVRINPAARIPAIFDALEACIELLGFCFGPEFDVVANENYLLGQVKHLVLQLLNRVSSLNQIPFWDSLDMPRSASGAHASSRGSRWREITAQQQLMKDGRATWVDVVYAMDSAAEVVRRMAAQFAVGKLYELEDAESQDLKFARCHCGAELPVLVEMMSRRWPTLRKKLPTRRLRRNKKKPG